MPSVKVLQTGVGAVRTTETLWQLWQGSNETPKVLIAVGLAGSYHRGLLPYTAVQVQAERWGDLVRRAVRHAAPLPPSLFEGFPLELRQTGPSVGLPLVEGLTLQSVSATRREARFWRRSYPRAAIETQENAAYFRFALLHQIPLYSLRLISNYAGERGWSVQKALEALTTFAAHVVDPLYQRLLAKS